MNGKALAEVALKTWGLILIVRILFTLPFAFVFIAVTAEEYGSVALALLNPLVELLFGLCLVKWGGMLAQRWIPDTPEIRLEVSARELRSIGFAIAGLFLLVSGLGVVTKAFFEFFLSSSWDGTFWAYLSGNRAGEFLVAVIQALVGSVLLFGWSAIARCLGLQSANHEPAT